MLITETYRNLNKQLHSVNASFGISGQKYAEQVKILVDKRKCQSVLDYGCGKGTLKSALGHPSYVKEYDPAVPGKDLPPEPADLVVCTDVMEHIEPECVNDVLSHIAVLSLKLAYIVIATGPAKKTLPDGRNAHLIQKGRDFWDAQIGKYFKKFHAMESGGNIYYVAEKA